MSALTGVAELNIVLQTERLLGQFPAKAHTWMAGQIPSGGRVRGK